MKWKRRPLPERVCFSIFMVYPTVFLWREFNFFNNRVLDIVVLLFLVFLFATFVTEIFGYLRRRYHSKKWFLTYIVKETGLWINFCHSDRYWNRSIFFVWIKRDFRWSQSCFRTTYCYRNDPVIQTKRSYNY